MHIALLRYAKTPNPVYAELAAALRRRGHIVWLATASADGHIAWHDGVHQVGQQQLPAFRTGWAQRAPWLHDLFYKVAFLWLIWRVKRFLQHHKPDIVQVNPSSIHGLWLLPIGMPRRTSFVLDWRQIAERASTGRIGRLKDRWASVRRSFYSTVLYDRACFLHAAGAKQVLGSDWSRWGTVVPLGVDAIFLQQKHSQQNQGNPQPKSTVVRFLYIGTLSRVRRLEQLLFAAQRLREGRGTARVAFQLTLIGPDTSAGFYQQQIEQLGLADIVVIKPPLPYEEIPQEALCYDVALAYVPEQPTDWQYHPTLKVLEYRALGLPILATDFEPNRAVVEEGINGLLASNQIESFAAAMARFIDDREFLTRCRRNAERMRAGATWRDVAELYEQSVYAPLVRQKRMVAAAYKAEQGV